MNISGFYPDSISNGKGWRAVLFVSGCPHRCLGCHNEQTWDRNYGTPYNEEAIYQQMVKNEFLDGITLSGGEPFLYYDKLLPLVKRVKEKDMNVWAYTGYLFEDLLKMSKAKPLLFDFLTQVDVLVDGQFEEANKVSTATFRGSSNQRLIDVPASLTSHSTILYSLED